MIRDEDRVRGEDEHPVRSEGKVEAPDEPAGNVDDLDAAIELVRDKEAGAEDGNA